MDIVHVYKLEYNCLMQKKGPVIDMEEVTSKFTINYTTKVAGQGIVNHDKSQF
jgi:hypothetical protein